MITEEQLNNFEKQVSDDALKAFNDMLASFKAQTDEANEIAANIRKYKKLLSDWAEKAHYKVNWEKYSATQFRNIGNCAKCNSQNIGLVDYNGHGYWVCESCNDRLEREFDDECK